MSVAAERSRHPCKGSRFLMEHPAGVAPAVDGFADRCLSTWLRMRGSRDRTRTCKGFPARLTAVCLAVRLLWNGADGRNRTDNPLFTRQERYPCATSAWLGRKESNLQREASETSDLPIGLRPSEFRWEESNLHSTASKAADLPLVYTGVTTSHLGQSG